MASRKQLVTFPKYEKPTELLVVLPDGENSVFYRHTVPAGETDFVIKVPTNGEFGVVILSGDKAVAGANGSQIIVSTLELKAPEPAKEAPSETTAPQTSV